MEPGNMPLNDCSGVPGNLTQVITTRPGMSYCKMYWDQWIGRTVTPKSSFPQTARSWTYIAKIFMENIIFLGKLKCSYLKGMSLEIFMGG